MRSLASRMTLFYAVAATLTTAAFMFVGRVLIIESYLKGLDLLNDNEFAEIEPRMKPYAIAGDEGGVIAAIREHTELDASFFFFQVGRSHNDVFFMSSNMGGHTLPLEVHGAARTSVTDEDAGRLRVAEYRVGEYDLHIASSLDGLYGLLENLYKLGGLSLMAVFLLSIVVGSFLSGWALRPIAAIQRTASRISAENLSERIKSLDTGDEVAQLGALLNSMFDRLERSFEEVRRFTADASHELKTPLALIRLQAERLKGRAVSEDEEWLRLVESQIEAVDSLNKVVNDLLILAKAEAGALRLDRGTHSVSDFVGDFAEDASALCEDRGLRFRFESRCAAQADFDPVWMRHVLFNLVSNAIRFSPPSGLIELDSRQEGGSWLMELRDEGPGIAVGREEQVFERFYNEEDPSGGKGSGLGLPLCRSIARLHGGDVTLSRNASGVGAKVVVRLPLAGVGP